MVSPSRRPAGEVSSQLNNLHVDRLSHEIYELQPSRRVGASPSFWRRSICPCWELRSVKSTTEHPLRTIWFVLVSLYVYANLRCDVCYRQDLTWFRFLSRDMLPNIHVKRLSNISAGNCVRITTNPSHFFRFSRIWHMSRRFWRQCRLQTTRQWTLLPFGSRELGGRLRWGQSTRSLCQNDQLPRMDCRPDQYLNFQISLHNFILDNL